MRDDEASAPIPPAVNRRAFITGGLTGVASIAFAALAARRAGAGPRPSGGDYGPIAPVTDLTTGLPLIALPAGFTYMSYGWTGQPMADGQPTPSRHDGMAMVAAQGDQIVLVRNHEQTTAGVKFTGLAAYENSYGHGGTTTVRFDAVAGKWRSAYASLSGTVRNCAGGRTPWGTWLTCEENSTVSPAGVRHGWIFEVPGVGKGTGQPLKAMGRSEWEACAVDPATGNVYQTEDATPGGVYKFVPNQPGHLAAGGSLYALKVVGQPDFNFSGLAGVYVDFPVGTTWNVEWVPVTDVEALRGRLYASGPGRAGFSRPEGAWYDGGKIYFTSTNGGVARRGQVFVYDSRREQLTIIFNSMGGGLASTQCNRPDNIAVSPRGGIILCEDGPGAASQKLRGLTQAGGTFLFADNLMNLTAADIAQADAALKAGGGVSSRIAPATYAREEWAGACFYEKWLFVNLQVPGITLAITGPWANGAL